MQFQIKIITTSVENKGKYSMLEVTYKRIDTGKVEAKKLASFTGAAFTACAGAKPDDIFTITSEKNEKSGYWDWANAVAEPPGYAPQTQPVSAKPGAVSGGTVRSTYETPEERAKKQVYIVKQSCLNQAVAVLSVGAKNPPDDGAILQKAQKYVDWVFEDNKAEVPSLMDMPNDFPDVE